MAANVNISTSPDTFGGLLYADGLSNGAKCPKATYPGTTAPMINLVGGWATWRPQYTTLKPYGHPTHPDSEKDVRGKCAGASTGSSS